MEAAQIRATKVCVRSVYRHNYKVMYLTNPQEKAELIVTTEQSIKYISPALYKSVVLYRSVKFVNSIATVILDYEGGVVMATFTTRLIESLVTENILANNCADPRFYDKFYNDQGELCEKSRVYHRLDIELRKQLDNLEMSVVNRTATDNALIMMLNKSLKLVDLAMGRLGDEISRENGIAESVVDGDKAIVDELNAAMREAASLEE